MFPINNTFNIKGDFTFRIYHAIQFYLWKENKVPDIEELATKFDVNNEETEKHVTALYQQDKLVFYIKNE